MTKPICDKDCFNCPHPDCINDKLEIEDYRALDEMEKDLRLPGYKEPERKISWYQKLSPEEKQKYLDRQKQLRREDPEARAKYKACNRRWYQNNKDRCLAQQRAYSRAKRKEKEDA